MVCTNGFLGCDHERHEDEVCDCENRSSTIPCSCWASTGVKVGDRGNNSQRHGRQTAVEARMRDDGEVGRESGVAFRACFGLVEGRQEEVAVKGMVESQSRCNQRCDSEKLNRVDELTAGHVCDDEDVDVSRWERLEQQWKRVTGLRNSLPSDGDRFLFIRLGWTHGETRIGTVTMMSARSDATKPTHAAATFS